MKRLFIILTAVLLTANLLAQTPEKMSYQAVVRNSDNSLVINTQVGMQISILQGSASGTALYVETQTATTNANGLVSIEIGSGIVENGDFSTIDWSNNTYFIKTETDPTGGTNYTITGVSQLLSVPYALHAKTAENTFSGDYNDLSNQPDLFSGEYNDLNNTPAIPENTSDLNNDSGFITDANDADADVTNEIQELSLSNDTLFIESANSIKLPGVKISKGGFCHLTLEEANNMYQQVGYDLILSSVKSHDGSLLEVTIQGHFYVSSLSSANGIEFQLRVNGQEPMMGTGTVSLKGSMIGKLHFLSFTGYFENIPEGSITVSLHAKVVGGASGVANGIAVNSGCYPGNYFTVKEYYAESE